MNTKEKTLGFIIKNARLDEKLTQEELAEKAGISVQYLKDIENRNNIPSLQVYQALMISLNISSDIYIHSLWNLQNDSCKQIELLMNRMNTYQLAVLKATAKTLVESIIT